MNRTYKRGDIYFADLGQGVGSEQMGYRPVVIIQNDIGNKHSPTVVVAAITSKVDARAKLPTHCFIWNRLWAGTAFSHFAGTDTDVGQKAAGEICGKSGREAFKRIESRSCCQYRPEQTAASKSCSVFMQAVCG